MTGLRLYLRALRALWRVGLLRTGPWRCLRVWLAWWRCQGTLAFLAEVAALRAGTRVALVDDDGALDFRELRRRYEALAAELIDSKRVGPGTQIALVGRNHRSLVVGLLAAVRTGADVSLLNPDSPPVLLARTLAELQGATGEGGAPRPLLLLHAAEVDVSAVAAAIPRLAVDASSAPPARPRPLPRLARPGQLCVLTSGSTGAPKRVGRRPTFAALLPTVLGLLESLPIAMYRPTVLAVPCFHGHGLATLAAALGFAAPLHLARRYEIAPLLARSSFSSLPVVVTVPTLLGRWLEAGARAGQVAAVLTGSAPLPPRLCRQTLATLGPVLYNLYGSSEAGVVALATPAMLASAPGSVGRPLPGTALRLVATAERACGPGQLGRIQVRGPLVVRPGADGWLDTGDLGRVDEGGILHVRGRADGMFVSGGENVYPQVVEACLLEHVALVEAAITVVPDAEFGARMRAFVVARPGAAITSEEVRAWLRERLDRHQQPRRIDVVDELPRNALGKLDRAALTRLAQRDPD